MLVISSLPVRPLALDDVTNIAATGPNHRFELCEGNLVVRPQDSRRRQDISTVLQLRLDGGRYTEHGSVPLDDLLAGAVPDLN